MAVRQARYSKEEFARRGDALYESEMSIEWFTVLVRGASNNPSPTCSRSFFGGFDLMDDIRKVSGYHPYQQVVQKVSGYSLVVIQKLSV
jgi:hypothetical protein